MGRILPVGADIGGTAIKVGAVDAGSVQHPLSRPTPRDFQACVALVAELAREASGGSTPPCIGVGVPGVIDPRRREVLDAPNLPWLEQQPLGRDLEEAAGCVVSVENDASAAAWGEAVHGAGQGHPDFMLATLGTGIGGGLVLGGRLFRGPGGMACEFGHLPVGTGRLCGCGARGCLEAAVSAPALVQTAREQDLAVMDLQELADRARRNQRGPCGVFQQAGVLLGEALAQVSLLLDLRVFLIGGGGGAVLDLLKPAALGTLSVRAFGRKASDFVLEPAALGNRAGMVGAALLAQERAGAA